MLAPDMVNCIRDSVQAESAPRRVQLDAALLQCDSEFAARGAFNSSMRLQRRGVLACQELTVRADIVWELIRRCQAHFGTPPDELLLDDLRQQIAEHITSQAGIVLAQAGATSTPDSVRWKEMLAAQVSTCRDEQIVKFSNEARFHVQAATQPPTPTMGGVTVNAQVVHAVLTGSHAVANIQINAERSARMVEALEQLRATIPQAAEMTAGAREQSLDLIGDLVEAAHAQKPNGLKLAGLLNGLAMSVQTVASLRPAWDFVSVAARAMGIPLP
jgi:hypothetical protein